MKNIAIIGFGVVGSGVYEIIRKNKEVLSRRVNGGIDLKKILDIRIFLLMKRAFFLQRISTIF